MRTMLVIIVLFCLIGIYRVYQVHIYWSRMIDQINKANEKDFLSVMEKNKDNAAKIKNFKVEIFGWRWKKFHEVTPLEMILNFWKPLDSFHDIESVLSPASLDKIIFLKPKKDKKARK